MDKLTLIKALLSSDESPKMSDDCFLTIGKVYAIRTVTMIYTGRLVKESKSCLLLEDCAWIPETERWMEFAKDGAHKEAEPYARPVTIFKGGILDITEIPNVITKQK